MSIDHSGNGRLRAEQRRNNRLPMAVGHASLLNIRRIVAEIPLVLATTMTPAEAVGVSAVQLMLFTGRPLENLCELRLTDADLFDDRFAGQSMLVRLRTGYALSMPAGGSPTRAKHDRRDGAGAEVVSNIILGLGSRTASCLRRLLTPERWDISAADVSAWRSDTKLFAQPADEVRAAVDRFLRDCPALRGRSGARRILSPHQLSHALRGQLLNVVKGDDAAVRIIVGNSRPTPDTASSYYLGSTIGTLVKYHKQAVEQLGIDKVEDLLIPDDEKKYYLPLGSCLVPTTSEVERLRGIPVQSLKIDRRRRASIPDLAQLHEALLVYTWLMWSICVGGRESSQPLPHPDQIDRATGFGFFGDKGYTPPGTAVHAVAAARHVPAAEALTDYKTRLLWIPPHVRAQLVAYQSHLELLLVDPRITAKNRVRLREAITRTPTRMAFVHLTPSLDVEPLRPGTFTAMLTAKPWEWNFPMNALRHFVRSSLTGKFSAETMDALLGHWEVGSEPWWNGSALDPLRYRSDLERAYAELLPVSDWPVLSGLKRSASGSPMAVSE
jgi:hypothetical protein